MLNLALALAATAALQASDNTLDPLPSFIQEKDWVYTGKVDDTYTFVKLHPSQPVIWLRIEHTSGEVRSGRAEFSVDCTSKSVTENWASYYRSNNLENVFTRSSSNKTTTPPPDTPLGELVEIVCSN